MWGIEIVDTNADNTFNLRQRRVRQMIKQVLNAIKIVDDTRP
ncbi:MAG: hypothetical protein C5S49_01625 [Candidatus Methanogaster sp.]|nr:MAG: hypothetical protein C5S49_01625 [ANME-2 cluster archaeon]